MNDIHPKLGPLRKRADARDYFLEVTLVWGQGRSASNPLCRATNSECTQHMKGFRRPRVVGFVWVDNDPDNPVKYRIRPKPTEI